MESKGQSANSGDFMYKNDSSSAVDRKKVTKTDGSSTPMESKRHCPDSGGRKSVIDNEGSSAMGRWSDPKDDGYMVADGFSRNVVKPTVQGSLSSALSTKRHGKGVVSDERCADIMFFADVTQGPHRAELRFHLIHFWEAQNPQTAIRGFFLGFVAGNVYMLQVLKGL